MRFSSILTSIAVILVVIAIPVTVVLTNRQQSQTSLASNKSEFSNPPTATLSTVDGKQNTYSVDTTDSNWYTVYFTDEIPSINTFNSRRSINKSLSLGSMEQVFDGSGYQEFTYEPSQKGKLFVIAYQLTNYEGQFEAGDIACSWDGHLYLYERKRTNVITKFVGENRERPGLWRNFADCKNSGALEIN